MRISDWSSDVCSSDLPIRAPFRLLTARCRHILFTQPAESSLRSNDDRIVHRPEEPVLYTFELRRDLDLAAELLGAQNGRAHVCTPVTNAHLACRPLLDKKTTTNPSTHYSLHQLYY